VSRNKTILIWDAISGDMPKHDLLVLWQSYETNNVKNQISIPRLIEEKAEKIKSQYLSLIYDLGEAKLNGKRIIEHLAIRPNFSYWWMTLLSEKCNYAKSLQIDNIIKIMALNERLKQEKFETILLVSSNRNLSISLSNRASILGVNYEWHKIANTKVLKNNKKSILRKLPHLLQGLLWIMKNLVSHWPLKGVGIKEWKQSEAKTTFISYLTNLDSDALKRGNFASNYWKGLLPLLEKQKIKSNWLHFYISSDLLPNSKTAGSAIKWFNKSYNGEQVHVTLYSFLSVKLVLSVILDWCQLLRLKTTLKETIEQISGPYWPLLRDDFFSSLTGITAMSNLLYLHLFEEAISSLQKQMRGFYLQENQVWEWGLVHAWRTTNHFNNLIGIPHTTVIYWNLRYFFDSRTYMQQDKLALPLPDKVGVNGEVAKKRYMEGGYPISDIIEVEALRFLHLNSLKKKYFKKEHEVEKRRTLLVLSDYLPGNVEMQMKLLQDASNQVRNEIKYVIKPHPVCPFEEEDYSEINFQLTKKPIQQLLKNCQVVFTSNATSAAVDAYCAGTHVITILNPTTLNLSPLKDNERVSFVSTPEELANVLNKVFEIKNIDTEAENYFFLDSELPRWRCLLHDKNNLEKQSRWITAKL
jgi:surface carbohydrate biosynthesis protein (TIGR04326 family)